MASSSQFLLLFLCGSGIVYMLTGCGANVTPATATIEQTDIPVLPPLTMRGQDQPDAVDSFSQRSRPRFRDIAADVGVDFSFHTDMTLGRFFLPEIMGGGVGCLDYDRDGAIDLFFPNGTWLIPSLSQSQDSLTDAFFRNRASGSQFDQVVEQARLEHPAYGQGCAAADYDADGFPDLYLTNYGDNVLYRNNGDGTFSTVDVPVLKGEQRWSTSAAWVDVDSNGWQDLYVVNYLDVTEENMQVCDYNGVAGYCGPGKFEALLDEVFVNLGDGGFESAAERLGLVAEYGKGLAVNVLDFDHDLQPEIYVANDMTENFLFSRTDVIGAPSTESTGRPYQNLALLAGCATSEAGLNEASMGIACADFDLDQRPDIYLTHYYHQKNTLYHNRANLTFFDDSRRFRVTAHSNDALGFGVVPLDYDSNGIMDLFVANGHVIGPNYSPFEMLPQLLLNVHGEQFEDVSAQAGDYFEQKHLGRGAAGVDIDNDGDSDLVVSHLDEPAVLLSNETPRRNDHVIGLILENRSRNTPVGGRIEIESGDYRRTHPVGSGGSYLSSPDPRQLISFPSTAESTVVRVFWTSGEITEYSELTPRRYWYLRENNEPIPLAEFTQRNATEPGHVAWGRIHD